jgi:hypothetical protein
MQIEVADLEREMKELAPRDQILHLDLKGRHPDDGFSGVPYVKGALFLQRIEEVFGRGRFDRFLRSYFDTHAFKSITTDQFVAYLERELFSQDRALAAKIDLAEWLGRPGLPADAPRFETKSLAEVDRQIEKWKSSRAPGDLETHGWVTQQWLHFLEGISAGLDGASMAALDSAFHLTSTGNSEVLDLWLRISISHGYSAADARLEEFLMTVGRRKYLEPLYKELVKSEAGKSRANALYAKARPRYHAATAAALDEILSGKKS